VESGNSDEMDQSMKLIRKSRIFILFAFLFLYLLGWHLVLTGISSWSLFSALKLLFFFKVLQYAGIAALITAGICFFSFSQKTVKKRWPRRIVFSSLLFFFSFDGAIRVLDWGTIYFSGQHVDSEFWYHAFYTDGTSFLLTIPAAVLIAVYLLCLFFFVKSYKGIDSFMAENFKKRAFVTIAKRNAAACGGLVLVFSLLFLSWSKAESSKRFYADFPEAKVIGSFADYMFGGKAAGEIKRAVLSKDTAEKLKKCGYRFSEQGEYPLMKKSIYLDSRSKAEKKPVIKTGQNVIVIFAESLSQFFLQEDQHGLKGLTPNIHAMMSESYEFTNMYCSNFPTIKGTIAALGSSLYTVSKMQGIRSGFRTPVPCNFFFLSNVLEKYGYTSLHVQGGSGIFGGMSDLFVKKQNYSKFLGWESVELQSFAKNDRNSDWGMRDEDIFKYTVKYMEENDNKKPFVLTISTIDMHPPFDALYKTPNAKGIRLLNCLYSTDKGIGVFWDYFKKSRYYKNTVVIVVADHAMGGGNEYETFLGRYKKEAHPFCDFIPCFMYLPGNKEYTGKKNATFCTNLDILPTLLDMMNVDCPNPFMGLSIFSERPKYPVQLTNFRLEDHPWLIERMPPAGKDAMKKLNWTAQNQEEFFNYMANLAVTRGFYPPLK
jgi:phosphoglycerol transferase MdoB-like AlkP superfamily enzyme